MRRAAALQMGSLTAGITLRRLWRGSMCRTSLGSTKGTTSQWQWQVPFCSGKEYQCLLPRLLDGEFQIAQPYPSKYWTIGIGHSGAVSHKA